MLDNLYNAARPAAENIFVGRDSEITQLINGLRSGRCFSLIGTPGIGKTSLLFAIQRALSEVSKNEDVGILPLPIYTECSRTDSKANEILTKIIRCFTNDTIPDYLGFKCPEEIQKAALSKANSGKLDAAFDHVQHWLYSLKKRSYLPVLLLDDLHRIKKPCFGKLATIIQTIVNKQKLAIILAGEHILSDELRNDVSPLRLIISQHLKLKPLNLNETKALIEKANVPIEEGFIDTIYEITNGQPYRLHYYLDTILSKNKQFTFKDLQELNTPDTINHLNSILKKTIEIKKTKMLKKKNPKKVLTWLHLSDLHYCDPKTGWDANEITKKLIEDLKKMEHEYGLTPDFIFFTGDLAFGNIKEEKGWNIKDQFDGGFNFLSKVCNIFSKKVPFENLFLVPGNHDVNRNEVTPPLTQWLDNLDDESKIIDIIKNADRTWKSYMNRLTDYRLFLERHNLNHLLNDPERLIYGVNKKINGINVGIGGFNSAWSCCRLSKDEKSKLWLGAKWQLNTIKSKLSESDLTITLIHHPPNWFREQEDKKFLTRLHENFNFCLHGHEHDDWVVTQVEDQHTTISASACYQGSDNMNGYNFVRLDYENQKGEVWLRKYNETGSGGWIPHILPNQRTDNNGKLNLKNKKWV